jgi:hypothetical protein
MLVNFPLVATNPSFRERKNIKGIDLPAREKF